ncbi:MAG TPA: DUF2344 domain-containing protein [Candidatus Galloscillospira excrementavium]|nr:DUF2344 domain-containing protein [Candidatus Galloscillospira excrementavium]
MPNKHRLHFSKTGSARYISHLDLMRTFQRAFLRAGLTIRHTEGYHPHAFVSLPLPLSVGFSSVCETLEFELLGGGALEEVPERMNAVLPAGITVQRCYEAVRPVKDLAYVDYVVTLEYESGAPFGAERAIQTLLAREQLLVDKKSKKAAGGLVQVDIIPLIARSVCEERRDTITLELVLRAQNPGLNPELVVAAIRRECPEVTPDYISFHRRQVLDGQFQPWE